MITKKTKDNFLRHKKLNIPIHTIITLRDSRRYDHHKIKTESYEKTIRNNKKSLKSLFPKHDLALTPR